MSTNFRWWEGQNISSWYIFAGAHKNFVSHILLFAESPKNSKNCEILYAHKFSGVRYVSWPQCIEKLHIIDKVGVQHQILDQIKAHG